MIDKTCRERTSCIQRNECFIQRTSEKQRWWEIIGTSQRGAYDCRAVTTHHCPVSQLSVYGAVADSCDDHAQRIKAHSPLGTKTPVANVDDDPASEVPSGRIERRRKDGATTRGEMRKSSRRLSKKRKLVTTLVLSKKCLSRTTLDHHSQRPVARMWPKKLMSRIYASSK